MATETELYEAHVSTDYQLDTETAAGVIEIPDDEPIFKYDKYMICDDGKAYLSEREYQLYCKMIDSVLSYDGTLDGFASYDEFFKVWGFFIGEFIPASHIVQTYLTADAPFYYEDGKATLAFADDKETCAENYAVFEGIINDALSLIESDDTDWERIAKLYLFVSDYMSYGSVYEEYGIHNDQYNALKYRLGMCTTYAELLNMLAQQIGFEAMCGHSQGKDGFEGADHAWSMICVQGEWYNFDACWQAPMITHENMEYFAFSTQHRYDTLARNSPWGEIGQVEMFDMDAYTFDRSPLPVCELTMDEKEKRSLYNAVFDEYKNGISKDIHGDVEAYINAQYGKIIQHVAMEKKVGISFGIKLGTLNGAVYNLIASYAPSELCNYTHLEDQAQEYKGGDIVIDIPDQSNLKEMMFYIISEDIVKQQTVRFVAM